MSGFSPADQRHMAWALDLAARGTGSVEPNPRVGCVIVSADGRVIGEGWHRRFGAPHAEPEALASCSEPTRGATAYVTLEPCDHHGKTPPCTAALLAAGFARVVVAIRDPFRKNPGDPGGLERLRAAGIAVEVGLMADAAWRLNLRFFKRLATGMPLVRFKWAMSLDGRIATAAGHSRWITGPEARAEGHLLRQRAGAVLVGAGTVITDDPLLTVRDLPPHAPDADPPRFPQPLRIALDPQRAVGPSRALVRTARAVPFVLWRPPALSANEEGADRFLTTLGAEIRHWSTSGREAQTIEVLRDIWTRGIDEVLVEGGARVLGGALAVHADCYDVFVAPLIVGEARARGPVESPAVLPAMPPAFSSESPAIRACGGDAWLSWTRVRPWWSARDPLATS